MDRRSDRSFTQQPLEQSVVDALVESFRWAPSSNNKQPWRLILARSEAASKAFDASLSDANRLWATVAPLKIVIVANPAEQPDRSGLQCFMLDCGLALENMLLQGYAMGLTIHAMAGWDAARVREGFAIGAPFEPVALVAAGYRGSIDDLAPEVQAKDRRPRVRKAVEEIVFTDRLG
jgi:nitroreductase